MSEAPDQSPDKPVDQRTREERVAACPIHAWMGDVDGYFEKICVPVPIRPYLDDLLLARGEYPVNVSDADAKSFAARAKEIVFASGVSAQDSRAMFIIFGDITSRWAGYEIAELAKRMAQQVRDDVRKYGEY